MGEQDLGRAGARLQLANEQAGGGSDASVGDKLSGFAHSLFQHGKSLLAGAEKQASNIDVRDLAARAQQGLEHANLGAVASQAGQVLQGMDAGKLSGIAGAAVGLGFPQLAILDRGSAELSGVIARRQAKDLLADPKKLSDKLLSSFDEFDRDKTGYLDDAKLHRFDGVAGIGSGNQAVGQILQSGYTTFNSLDGDASRKGISRRDIEVFSMLQNKELLNDYVDKQAFDHALLWGAGGALAGGATAYFRSAGMNFSLDALRTVPLGRAGAMIAVGALALGGIADLISRKSQHDFYDQKSKDLNQMLDAMKNSF